MTPLSIDQILASPSADLSSHVQLDGWLATCACPIMEKKILLVFRSITQLVNFAKDIESTRFFYSIFRGGGGDEIAWVQVDVGLCKP